MRPLLIDRRIKCNGSCGPWLIIITRFMILVDLGVCAKNNPVDCIVVGDMTACNNVEGNDLS